jgi:lipopolysaccharide/colanic/teichoic acid biosynthesis glycosyltransferase
MRAVLDSLISVIALVVLSPVLLVVAAAVLVEDGLPILFAQDRVGRKGKLFRLLKFRTMRDRAAGPTITASGDSRITRVGGFLRKFKLDELPQFWNVVRGEMSVVGPRPEVPQFVDLSSPVWRAVLEVRPGITDPASIAFRHEEALIAKAADPIRYYRECVLPSKLAMNLAYLKNRSPWMDFKVILETACCAIFPGMFEIKEPQVMTPEDSE